MEQENTAPKKHFNISKEKAIKINEVRDQIVSLQNAREGNIENYEKRIEKLSEQKWFLEKIVLDGIGLSLDEKEEEKYAKLHEELYVSTEQAIKDYQGKVKVEQEDLEVVVNFLEMFDSHVKITVGGALYEKGEVHYEYDKTFFSVIMNFARAINLGGLF